MSQNDDIWSDTSQDSTSTSTDICEIARINEWKEWKMMPLDSPFLNELDRLLMEVYKSLLPKPIDYEQRKMLVDVFNSMSSKVFGKNEGFPTVEEFGSFKMDLFTSQSDLDISVNFSDDPWMVEYPREEKMAAMKKLCKALYQHQEEGHVRGVLPVLTARVPVLKLVDCRTEVEIDISVENKDGILRSQMIYLVSQMDSRFRILSYLMKMWAKANKINCSRDRTISSMAITTLVAFHLQTRDPPILPPFSALLKDGMDISSIEKIALEFKKIGSANKESIAELFLSIICKLKSVEYLWEEGLCASTFEGSWIFKTWSKNTHNFIPAMAVEDFVDRSENFARSVGKRKEMKKINSCTENTLQYLCRFLYGQVNSKRLRTYIFGTVSSLTKLPVPVVPVPLVPKKRFTWDDIPVPPPFEGNRVPVPLENNKRKRPENEYNVVKRSRYNEPVREMGVWYQKEPVPAYHPGGPVLENQYHLRDPFVPYLNYGHGPLSPNGPIAFQPNPSFSHQYHEPHPNPSFSHFYREHEPNPSFPHRYHEPQPNPNFPHRYREPQANRSFPHQYREPQANRSFPHRYCEPQANPSFPLPYHEPQPNPRFSHMYHEHEPNYTYGHQNFRR